MHEKVVSQEAHLSRRKKKGRKKEDKGRKQASLKLFCACKCRSETNLPAEKTECNR